MILKSTASPLVIQVTPHFGTLSSFITNTFQPPSHPVYTAFKMVGLKCKSNPVVNPSIQDFPGGPQVETQLSRSLLRGLGSIPGWGTKIPQVTQCSQKKKKKSKFLKLAFKLLSHWLWGQFNSPIISLQSQPMIQVIRVFFHSPKEAWSL